MKTITFAFLLLVVGSSAFPQELSVQNADARCQRLVTNTIRRVIDQARRAIRDAGLDPVSIDREEFEYTVVPFLVTVTAWVDSLRFTGASNIAINSLQYRVLSKRLTFDLSLPQLNLSIGEAGAVVNAFGTRYAAELGGSLVINQIRVTGDVRVRVGIFNGIRIRSMALTFRIQNIRSNLRLIVLGNDLSDDLNNIFNVVIPDLLTTFRTQIDTWLTNYVRAIADEILSRNLVLQDDAMITL